MMGGGLGSLQVGKERFWQQEMVQGHLWIFFKNFVFINDTLKQIKEALRDLTLRTMLHNLMVHRYSNNYYIYHDGNQALFLVNLSPVPWSGSLCTLYLRHLHQDS